MNATHGPSIEDRLMGIEHVLALQLMLARAQQGGNDLMLDEKDEYAAWVEIDHAMTRALVNLRAVTNALTGEDLNRPTPDVEDDAPGKTTGQ